MKPTTVTTTTTLAAMGLIALLVLPLSATAADPVPSIEALASQMATTADQHEAVAKHYREKAMAARAEATKHRAMAASYGNRDVGASTYMRTHCNQLVDAAEKSAAAYDAMASFHEDAAKKAGK